MNCQQVAGNGWVMQWWDWKRALHLTEMTQPISVFLCYRGLWSKPITVNLAFSLNIIGSGSNPACFDSFCLLCLLKLYLVPSQMRKKEQVVC